MQDATMAAEKDNYQYKFSIVMAVYNVAPFLEEAVESLLQQTIGFAENVQLIMVDDGSQDGSGEICDYYKKQYPENIVVIHKENGGVSSARNEGLKYIKGKYVNFLDSDDKLSENTLEEVYLFFEQHYMETDIVAIPMYFFDGQTGEHILNYKFKKGTCVIDLRKEYTYIQLSMPSAFFRHNIMQSMRFDKNLQIAEDAKEILKLLTDRMTLGAVSTGGYYYRRRSTGESSAIQNSENNKNWYTPYLEYFVKGVYEYCNEQLGYIPRFIQYSLMYDLQWKIKQKTIPQAVLTEEEKDTYYKLLFQLTSCFDDEIILKQKNLPIEYKTFLLRKKYETYPSVTYYNQDIGLYFKNSYVTNCCNHKMVIEFISFQNENIVIEGYGVYIPFKEYHSVQIYCTVNEKIVLGEPIERNEKEKRLNGELVLGATGFQVTLPVSMLKTENEIVFYTVIDDLVVKKGKLSWGPFSPVTDQYQNQYYRNGRWVVVAQKKCIKIFKMNKQSVMLKEIAFIFELLKSKKNSDKKAGLSRIAYQFLKHFKRKEIWLLSDRVNKADDNGEALFEYINSSNKVHSYFVLGKESQDIDRLKKIGKVLIQNSWKHKLFHLLSDKIVSSQADHFTTNPFGKYVEPYRDILKEKKFVFLQHGIIKDDLSDWLNRRNKNIEMFVTAAKPEYQSILNYNYDYDNSIVKLTGLPRHDRLYHDEKRIIAIIPTWRSALVTGLDADTGLRKVKTGFERSKYNEMYSGLLTNERFIESTKKYGYQVYFLQHPNMTECKQYMEISSEIKVLGLEVLYRKIFAESSLLVTDYSSVVFDFTYLRKPVLYFQQDKEEFFSNHTYKQGYFDYERDGLGEVCYDLETLVSLIIEYMENDCQLKDKYRKRIDDFFAYNDRNNCQRVYEEILKL